MVCLVYAYAEEVNSLKQAVSQLYLKQKLYWLNWRPGLKLKPIPNKVKLIINLGFAGSLNGKFSCGEVCQVSLFLAKENGYLLKAKSSNSLTKLKILLKDLPTATLYTSSLPVVDAKKKQALALETQADLVDMEAFWLLQQAQTLNIPFCCLKVVSDFADAEAKQMVKANQHYYAQVLAKAVLPLLEALAK